MSAIDVLRSGGTTNEALAAGGFVSVLVRGVVHGRRRFLHEESAAYVVDAAGEPFSFGDVGETNAWIEIGCPMVVDEDARERMATVRGWR